jgi:glycolate oxidase iron-sulfur subunit
MGMSESKAPESLKKALDRCVKCGLCLPECPTYRLTRNENESPRGRLALIEALVDGRLRADDPDLARHLDYCLACRRCERVCPSGVPYGRLIDSARAMTRQRFRAREWLWQPRLQHWGSDLARHLPLALSRPFPPLNRMHRLACALPSRAAAPSPGVYPAHAARRARVGLFTGCVTVVQQGAVLQAALRVLQHAGCEVVVPGSVCCGAMQAHAGDREGATRRADLARAAFPPGLDAIVSIASGCGVHLDAFTPPLTAPHRDICAFLVDSGALDRLQPHALDRSLLLHVPCSVENVYRGRDWAREILARLRPSRLETVGVPGQCCGAAGDYLLRHPQTAAVLRSAVIDAVAAAGSTLLATSNVGCAMHLAAGCSESGLAVEVVHPVELLARQLPTDDEGMPRDARRALD